MKRGVRGIKIITEFVLTVMVAFLCTCSTQAADVEYRVMHGEQDALVVGEILQITEEGYLVKVWDNIICKDDTTLFRQLPVDQIPEEILLSSLDYFSSYHNRAKPVEGDYIVVAVDKKKEHWEPTMKALEVSSADTETLEVKPAEEMMAYRYVWQLFIRSKGEINEAVAEEGSVYVNGDKVFTEGQDKVERNYAKSAERDGTLELKFAGDEEGLPDDLRIVGTENDVNGIALSRVTIIFIAFIMLVLVLIAVCVVVIKQKGKLK